MARSGAANEAGARGGVTRTSFLNTGGWKMAFGGMRQRYVRLGAINTTPGGLSVLSLFHSLYISLFFFFFFTFYQNDISFPFVPPRNEFIQVFNRNQMLVLLPISFRYHLN